MSTPRPAPKTVRDPIHGYIFIAGYERIVVDHPVTQRLRNVLQTGLTHLVFPEARTSRFAHSLGAMHLASRFLISALENSEPSVAQAFFASFGSAGVFSAESLYQDSDADRLMADEPLFARRALLDRFGNEAVQYRRLLAVAEASLRLAALFHDLGHLPFSHDFETALRAYARQQNDKPVQKLAANKPHEAIGHKLARLVLATLVGQETVAVRAAYNLATQILETEKPGPGAANALYWLHCLVDGEVDVDRADYLLRDARALGMEFANYDLERLIDNLTIVEDKEGFLGTAVREKGLSAVESFFVSRARSHQLFVRHHKVSQIAAALRHISARCLASASGKDLRENIRQLIDAKDDASASELLVEFASYDDSWWLMALRQFEKDAQHDELTKACFDLALRRQPTLRSAWKRRGELSPEQRKLLNDQIANVDEDALAKRGILFATYTFSPYRQVVAEKAEAAPVSESKGVVEKAEAQAPPVSEFEIEIAPGDVVPMTKLSPLLQSLGANWDEDVHAHAFSAKAYKIDEVLAIVAPPKGS